MTGARNIIGGSHHNHINHDDIESVNQSFANQLSISTSPTSTFHSPPRAGSFSFTPSFGAARGIRANASEGRPLKPFATEDIKILLLENVNKTGIEILENQGYQVEAHKASLPEDELIKKIRSVINRKIQYVNKQGS